MKSIDKLQVLYHDKVVGSLGLSKDKRLCIFEYSREWLVNGFSISPLELPLEDKSFVAKSHPFGGAFGVFEDSLPDGYGRYLLHKALQREGLDDSKLTSLDRLSIVGSGGMGALCYVPENHISHAYDVQDFDLLQKKALEVLSEKQSTDADLLLFNSGNSGGARPKAVFVDSDGHWLVKFRHTYDPQDIGRQEYRYNEAALKCGIEVPRFKLVNDKYFATERFDIAPDGQRVHVITAGGILGVSVNQPILDYANLLALTGFLTQDKNAVEQMYRRMLFNYFTENKDDHSKNFSFVMCDSGDGKYCWKLAPAYDLTLCTQGYNGQHATSVNGTGSPAVSDFVAVGAAVNMPAMRCNELIEEVKANCADLYRYDI